jgi:hypothetical protein
MIMLFFICLGSDKNYVNIKGVSIDDSTSSPYLSFACILS